MINEILIFWILASFLVASGCDELSKRHKKAAEVILNDPYEVFVAPATPMSVLDLTFN